MQKSLTNYETELDDSVLVEINRKTNILVSSLLHLIVYMYFRECAHFQPCTVYEQLFISQMFAQMKKECSIQYKRITPALIKDKMYIEYFF